MHCPQCRMIMTLTIGLLSFCYDIIAKTTAAPRSDARVRSPLRSRIGPRSPLRHHVSDQMKAHPPAAATGLAARAHHLHTDTLIHKSPAMARHSPTQSTSPTASATAESSTNTRHVWGAGEARLFNRGASKAWVVRHGYFRRLALVADVAADGFHFDPVGEGL